jgi:acyl-CoA synthetase (NDP forming)
MSMVSATTALFRPRSIALIGASGDASKHAALPQQYLRKHNYPGRIYPINASRNTVLGERAYPSIGDVPEKVDHAFIMLPSNAIEDAIEQCCTAGVACATILSNGFAEAGAEGRVRQERLVKTAREGGLRILGPNSLGMINLADDVALSANEILSVPSLLKGGYSLVSQSGSLIGALLSRGIERGFGFSKMVSVGNEADLSVAEIGEMLIEDTDTDAILLFLETIRNADGLEAMSRSAHRAGKPVIAFRVGRSEIGAQLAQSHTGALAGSGAAMDAFLKDVGIVRVETIDGLLEAPPLFRHQTPPKSRRVSVLTTTGGGGALIIDALAQAHIEVVPPSEAVVTRLQEKGISITRAALIDLTLTGTNPQTYGAVLSELAACDGNDLVVAVVGSSSQFRPDRAVAPIVQVHSEIPSKPVTAFLTPNATDSLAILHDAKISAFRTPESCADVIGAFFDWQTPRDLSPADIPNEVRALLRSGGNGRSFDAAMGADLFAALGVPMAEQTIFSDDIATWTDTELNALSYPVVAKILSADVIHKSDIGGVAVGITSANELRQRGAAMVKRFHVEAKGAQLTGIQIQPMIRGCMEALLGLRRDPAIGPVVTLAAGGVLTEIYRDVSIRRAPVDHKTALDMIGEVKAFAIVNGYRGLPRGDLDGLAKAIAAFSQLAQLEVAEAEINPMLIREDGVVGLDAVLLKDVTNAT